MAETEQIDRSEQVRADAARSESGRGHAESPVSNGLQSPVRASGSPLPVGAGGRALQTHGHSQPLKPPPGRALNGPARREDEHSMGMQWALGALKQADRKSVG